MHLLQRFAPGHERREEQVAQLSVLVEQCPQRVAFDGDKPKRLDHNRVDEDGLASEQIQLADKVRRAVPYELVGGGVSDRYRSLKDDHQRVRPVADLVEQITDSRRALLADLSKSGDLRLREQRTQRRGQTLSSDPRRSEIGHALAAVAHPKPESRDRCGLASKKPLVATQRASRPRDGAWAGCARGLASAWFAWLLEGVEAAA